MIAGKDEAEPPARSCVVVLLLGDSCILERVGAPNIQVFLVARGFHGDISLSRYAIQGRAKILHLLAVQTAERNLDRLLGVQLGKVAQNIRHRLPMFSFTTLRNIGSIQRRIMGVVSVASHGWPPFVRYPIRKREIVS